MPEIKVAIAWLRADDWPTWQALDDDLPDYDIWLLKITGAIERVERKGLRAERIEIDPELFAAWCQTHRKTICADARAQFAAVLLSLRRVVR